MTKHSAQRKAKIASGMRAAWARGRNGGWKETRQARPLEGPNAHPFLRETNALEDRVLAAGTNGSGVLARGLAEIASRLTPGFAEIVALGISSRAEMRARQRCAQCHGGGWVDKRTGKAIWAGHVRVRVRCPRCGGGKSRAERKAAWRARQKAARVA